MALSVEDQLALQKLYADYCHAIDDGDGTAFAACFTVDGSLDVGYGDPVVGTESLDGFVGGVAQMMPGMRHQVTNLTLDGDGEAATGRAYLYTYRAGANGHEVIMTGRYTDTLRKVDGDWRFGVRSMVPDTPPA
jgi:ketosteroid isomerase-like protein